MSIGDHPPHDDGGGPTAGPGVDAAEIAQLRAELAAALTLWASPGLVDDRASPHLGTVPVLTITPQISVHTHDDHPGAEPVDVVLAAMLAAGYALLTAPTPAALLALPTPAGWSGRLDAAAAVLTLTGPDGDLYSGDLGAAPPPGWAAEVSRRGQLVVLVASAVDLAADDRTQLLDAARRAGRVVGALLPIASGPG